MKTAGDKARPPSPAIPHVARNLPVPKHDHKHDPRCDTNARRAVKQIFPHGARLARPVRSPVDAERWPRPVSLFERPLNVDTPPPATSLGSHWKTRVVGNGGFLRVHLGGSRKI